MKKRLFAIFTCLTVALALMPVPVSADMGPKAATWVYFDGLQEEIYYVTLLSREESTGPYSVSDEPIDEESCLLADIQNPALGKRAWEAFRNYQDKDGFYFIEYFEKMGWKSDQTETEIFSWIYYPPDEFKILLYFPEYDAFAVSGIEKRYAFHSDYTVDGSELDFSSAQELSVTAQKSYSYTGEILSLLLRIVLTIGVELLIALPFGLRRKNLLLFITLINVITQVILNVLLNLSIYFGGGWLLGIQYFVLEWIVFAVEAAAYLLYFSRAKGVSVKRWIAPVYALTANAASFALGMLLIYLNLGFI
ncbi:hypothetical protein [Massiliimalia massiliensis]|uniref:hypothetical protein n=1 Tax=Massiliimalia massiliensis TaxID=1852384 RepID=UPI0009861894|nr:hypothetical protein [Massiliimalia massiliensis]